MSDVLDSPAGHAFAYRFLLDVWLDGSRLFWERRARQLEAAKPRRSDFTGRATPQDLTAAAERLDQAAAACRARAVFTTASQAAFHDTLHAMAAGAPPMTLEEAERALRAAIDRDDRHAIAALEQTIDTLAPPAAAHPTRRATAAA